LVALRRAIRAAGHRRLVLAVYSRARRAPLIAGHRRQYCGFVGGLLFRAGRVRDVVIWNEPNLSTLLARAAFPSPLRHPGPR
jgi:hypothetical protein